jgi:hypothetical protein
MDIGPQKNSWSIFKKLTFYTSVAIILILILMAFFLI